MPEASKFACRKQAPALKIAAMLVLLALGGVGFRSPR